MRHIPLKNAFNVRDMGGYPTTDGKSTKWGMLYRSDALSSLTEEDLLNNIQNFFRRADFCECS